MKRLRSMNWRLAASRCGRSLLPAISDGSRYIDRSCASGLDACRPPHGVEPRFIASCTIRRLLPDDDARCSPMRAGSSRRRTSRSTTTRTTTRTTRCCARSRRERPTPTWSSRSSTTTVVGCLTFVARRTTTRTRDHRRRGRGELPDASASTRRRPGRGVGEAMVGVVRRRGAPTRPAHACGSTPSTAMHGAQRLYERLGFVRDPALRRGLRRHRRPRLPPRPVSGSCDRGRRVRSRSHERRDPATSGRSTRRVTGRSTDRTCPAGATPLVQHIMSQVDAGRHAARLRASSARRVETLDVALRQRLLLLAAAAADLARQAGRRSCRPKFVLKIAHAAASGDAPPREDGAARTLDTRAVDAR